MIDPQFVPINLTFHLPTQWSIDDSEKEKNSSERVPYSQASLYSKLIFSESFLVRLLRSIVKCVVAKGMKKIPMQGGKEMLGQSVQMPGGCVSKCFEDVSI
jgi:hypothetical protein